MRKVPYPPGPQAFPSCSLYCIVKLAVSLPVTAAIGGVACLLRAGWQRQVSTPASSHWLPCTSRRVGRSFLQLHCQRMGDASTASWVGDRAPCCQTRAPWNDCAWNCTAFAAGAGTAAAPAPPATAAAAASIGDCAGGRCCTGKQLPGRPGAPGLAMRLATGNPRLQALAVASSSASGDPTALPVATLLHARSMHTLQQNIAIPLYPPEYSLGVAAAV